MSNLSARALTNHPVAELFPVMSEAEYTALRDDIKANGQREPIWVWRGMVIDGRHRLRACEELGKTCHSREYLGDEDAVLRFVISLNLHRRHLNESQRALVASRLANMRQGERTDTEPSANLQKVSQATAAEMLNVSTRSVAAAAKVDEEGAPELVAAVEAGEVSVSAAAEVATLPKAEQVEVVAKKGTAKAAKAVREKRQKPQAVKTDKPSPEEKLKARIAELEDHIERLEIDLTNAQDAAEENSLLATNLQAMVDGVGQKRFEVLTAKLRAAEATRDGLLNENAALKRQIKQLERRVGRAA
jgi:ParB-like chromosome segregation protein Spo0J